MQSFGHTGQSNYNAQPFDFSNLSTLQGLLSTFSPVDQPSSLTENRESKRERERIFPPGEEENEEEEYEPEPAKPYEPTYDFLKKANQDLILHNAQILNRSESMREEYEERLEELKNKLYNVEQKYEERVTEFGRLFERVQEKEKQLEVVKGNFKLADDHLVQCQTAYKHLSKKSENHLDEVKRLEKLLSNRRF